MNSFFLRLHNLQKGKNETKAVCVLFSRSLLYQEIEDQEEASTQYNMYIKTVDPYLFVLLNWFKLVDGSFGQSPMHRSLISCTKPARKKPNLKSTKCQLSL